MTIIRIAEIDHFQFVVDADAGWGDDIEVPDATAARWREAYAAWRAVEDEIYPFHAKAEHARGLHRGTFFDCETVCGEPETWRPAPA